MPADAESIDIRRARMLAAVEQMARDTGCAVPDARVLDALHKVDRHRFVPQSQSGHAYENRALPIDHEQTISQPYIVALMTDLLNVGTGDRVLEVGTGSGYQTAVLAELVRAVCTIEIIEPQGRAAAGALAAAG